MTWKRVWSTDEWLCQRSKVKPRVMTRDLVQGIIVYPSLHLLPQECLPLTEVRTCKELKYRVVGNFHLVKFSMAYFHTLKAYFQALKAYFQTLKAYFPGLESVISDLKSVFLFSGHKSVFSWSYFRKCILFLLFFKFSQFRYFLHYCSRQHIWIIRAVSKNIYSSSIIMWQLGSGKQTQIAHMINL